MFRYLRLKQKREKIVVDSGRLTAEWLSQDECFPATLKQINDLPEGAKRRIYRALLPPTLLFQFDIDPINWKKHGDFELLLKAEKQCGEVNCSIRSKNDSAEEVFCLQLMDNTFNGIDLNFILVSDPCSPFFGVDRDKDGRLTMFGKANRNLEEEQRAMQAGLAPGQARRGDRGVAENRRGQPSDPSRHGCFEQGHGATVGSVLPGRETGRPRGARPSSSRQAPRSRGRLGSGGQGVARRGRPPKVSGRVHTSRTARGSSRKRVSRRPRRRIGPTPPESLRTATE